jgi:hypothetical protein
MKKYVSNKLLNTVLKSLSGVALLTPLHQVLAQNEPQQSASSELGKLPDGRAYRVDAEGNQLVDHIAELEVEKADLAKQVEALSNDIEHKEKLLEQVSSSATAPKLLPVETTNEKALKKALDTAQALKVRESVLEKENQILKLELEKNKILSVKLEETEKKLITQNESIKSYKEQLNSATVKASIDESTVVNQNYASTQFQRPRSPFVSSRVQNAPTIGHLKQVAFNTLGEIQTQVSIRGTLYRSYMTGAPKALTFKLYEARSSRGEDLRALRARILHSSSPQEIQAVLQELKFISSKINSDVELLKRVG